MVTIKIHPANLDGYGAFGQFATPVLGDHSGKSAEFNELNGNGDRLVFEGKGLRYEAGRLVEGIITSMTMYAPSGAKLGSLTDAKFAVTDLPDMRDYWGHYSMEAMIGGADTVIGSAGIDVLTGGDGKDVVKGLAGNDLISDGMGNDKSTGGAGADDFYFNSASGRNIITDFQSDGAQETHDQIYIDGTFFDVRQDGKNVVVEFDGGASITLLDIDSSEIDVGDIVLI